MLDWRWVTSKPGSVPMLSRSSATAVNSVMMPGTSAGRAGGMTTPTSMGDSMTATPEVALYPETVLSGHMLTRAPKQRIARTGTTTVSSIRA